MRIVEENCEIIVASHISLIIFDAFCSGEDWAEESCVWYFAISPRDATNCCVTGNPSNWFLGVVVFRNVGNKANKKYNTLTYTDIFVEFSLIVLEGVDICTTSTTRTVCWQAHLLLYSAVFSAFHTSVLSSVRPCSFDDLWAKIF